MTWNVPARLQPLFDLVVEGRAIADENRADDGGALRVVDADVPGNRGSHGVPRVARQLGPPGTRAARFDERPALDGTDQFDAPPRELEVGVGDSRVPECDGDAQQGRQPHAPPAAPVGRSVQQRGSPDREPHHSAHFRPSTLVPHADHVQQQHRAVLARQGVLVQAPFERH